jgi:hypothetical protein
VAVGPIDFFQFSVAVDGDELIEIPGGFAAGHNRFDLRADDGPDFQPTLGAVLAKSARMFVRANAGTITVVVELNKARTSPQEHGMPGGQHHVDGCDQNVWPAVDGAERSGTPRKLPSEPGHFAVADNSMKWGSVRHQ